MVLTGAHYIFFSFMIIIFLAILMKKDIIIPSIIGIFLLGVFYSSNIAGGISAVFDGFLMALQELGPIILLVSIIIALFKSLEENQCTNYIAKPFNKIIKNPASVFFTIGILTMVLSWIYGPIPAIVTIGIISLPIAINSGLPAMGLAIALNLFGYGVAFSTDLVDNNILSMTSKGAGISTYQFINEGMILFWIMSIVTIGVAYYRLRIDMKKRIFKDERRKIRYNKTVVLNKNTKLLTYIVVIGFVLDFIYMYKFKMSSQTSYSLLGGSSIFLLIIVDLIGYGKNGLTKVYRHITEGFITSIKIFSIIIPIAALYYMGQGNNLIDIFDFYAIGSMASNFANVIGCNVVVPMALGQILSIWIGAGCLVPWIVAISAAICGVNPIELAKRNFTPIVVGLIVTTIVALLMI